ncbi:universal stress protein in QAH/OAS sulfhydrylase 3'region-like [Saccostrea echinata]|uniref:universal stress protein in QAH/OAS sulfhydrylase 3'region-like n=1 Tax=Saccostrea echinata TaxID=191078 RepID=UPI002A81EA3E|nr:universal stress protein in QAH/OAS sulfhydrylase 3'region-like [Saccostrea echinata]
MADKQRTIVVAMDGSEHAVNAFKWFCKSIKRDDDQVVMVYSVEVYDPLYATQWFNVPYSVDRTALKAMLEKHAEEVKKKLEQFAEIMRSEHASGKVRSTHAEKPGEGILKTAKDLNADMIVLGTRGMGTIRRTILGSVSDYVLHHSSIPVIICPPK